MQIKKDGAAVLFICFAFSVSIKSLDLDKRVIVSSAVHKV